MRCLRRNEMKHGRHCRQDVRIDPGNACPASKRIPRRFERLSYQYIDLARMQRFFAYRLIGIDDRLHLAHRLQELFPVFWALAQRPKPEAGCRGDERADDADTSALETLIE